MPWAKVLERKSALVSDLLRAVNARTPRVFADVRTRLFKVKVQGSWQEAMVTETPFTRGLTPNQRTPTISFGQPSAAREASTEVQALDRRQRHHLLRRPVDPSGPAVDPQRTPVDPQFGSRL